MPQKFAFVLSNCTDPARVHEFNRWYSAVHVLDIISTEGFVRGTRYALTGDASPDQWQFLALYEIQTDDSYRSLNERHMADRTRIYELAPSRAMPEFIATAHIGFFEQISADAIWAPPGAGQVEPPRSLLLELAVCDADASDAVERWYRDVHLPAVARSSSIARAAAYGWPRPRGGRRQFLALHALEDGDAATVDEALTTITPDTPPDGLRRLATGSYGYLSDIVRTWPSWDDLRVTTAERSS